MSAPFIVDMKQHFEEFKDRKRKAKYFAQGKAFKGLAVEDQHLHLKQLKLMEEYLEVLDKRLERAEQ